MDPFPVDTWEQGFGWEGGGTLEEVGGGGQFCALQKILQSESLFPTWLDQLCPVCSTDRVGLGGLALGNTFAPLTSHPYL